jgi:hypothetical protein
MSFETFYNEFLNKTDLEKWIGLRKKNLEKHCLEFDKETMKIYDQIGNNINIDASTCQLCLDYFQNGVCIDCEECPIMIKYFRPCLHEYSHFGKLADPEPMIHLLKTIKNLPKREQSLIELLNGDEADGF